MSDFNDLVDDAENFAEEDNVDDYYPAEFSIASDNNKRANDDNFQPSNKRTKPVTHLADYFSESSNTRDVKVPDFEEKKIKASEISYNQNNYGVSLTTDENNSSKSTGPNCLCGIVSVSKTTLKEGPNKNRLFWVRPAQIRATMRPFNPIYKIL